MRTGRAALLVAGTDLRRRLRNRSFVLQALVGPIALASIISLAFGGGITFEVEVAIVTADRSVLASSLREELLAADLQGVRFVEARDADAARSVLADVGAALIVPAGFEASLSQPEPLALEIVTDPDNPVGGAVARSVAQELAARVDTARMTLVASAAAGAVVDDVRRLVAELEPPITVDLRSPGEEPSPAAHFGPGMGLLFLFLTVGIVARGLIEERRRGLLDRIRAAPVRLSALLVGRCLSVVAISAVSLTVIWAATTVLLGADWGSPFGVLALIGAASLAVAGIAGLIASLVRTERTAETVATLVAFALSLVGGNMLPLADLPEGLRRLSLFTPNGWALQGFAELSVGGGSLADVALHVGVLCAWALGMGTIAAVLLPARMGAR